MVIIHNHHVSRTIDLDPQFHVAALTGSGCAHYLKELEWKNKEQEGGYHLAVHQDENRNPSVRSHGIKVLRK